MSTTTVTSTAMVEAAFSGFLTVLNQLVPFFILLFGVTLFLFAFYLMATPLMRGIKRVGRRK